MTESELSELAGRYRDLLEEVRQLEVAWAADVLPAPGSIVRLSAKRKLRMDRFESVRLLGNQLVEFKASGRLLRPDGLPSQRVEWFSQYLCSQLAEQCAPRSVESREGQYRALVENLKAMRSACFMQVLPPVGTDVVSQEGVSLRVLSHDRCVVSEVHLLVIGSACRVSAAGRRRKRSYCEIEVEIAMPRGSGPKLKVSTAIESTQAVSRSQLSSRDARARSPSRSSSMGLPNGNRAGPSLDATRSFSDVFREGGRFGSHPGHDAFDDESGA